MPTEKNLASLVINEVESTTVYEEMKRQGLLNDDELYLVTDPENNINIDQVPTAGSKNLVYSGGVYDALQQAGSADSVNEWNNGEKQRFWRGTKEEYEALAEKPEDTLFILTDDEGEAVTGGSEIPVTSEPGDNVNVWIDPNEEGNDEGFYTRSQTDELVANKADVDLSNVSNENFLAKVESSGFSSGLRIATGSYAGNGKYGASNPCKITLPFEPKIIMLTSVRRTDNGNYWQIAGAGYGAGTYIIDATLLTDSYVLGNGFGEGTSSNANSYGKLVGLEYSWYNTNNANTQMNHATTVYTYMVIG